MNLLVGSTGTYIYPWYSGIGLNCESNFTVSRSSLEDAESIFVIFDGESKETQLLMKDVIFINTVL